MNKIIKFDSKLMFENSNVYRLSELKPAGVKLILDPKISLFELLKLTLFDLILKKVLVIRKVLKKPHPRDPYLTEYTLVETAENFEKYNPNHYEKYFTKRINKCTCFQLRVFLREIVKEIQTESKYKNEIIRDLKIQDLFKRDFFTVTFSIFSTNHKGNRLKIEINEYLEEVDRNIENLIVHEPEKALKLVMMHKGTMIPLINLKFQLIERLKLVSKVPTKRNNDYFDDWVGIDFMRDFHFSLN